MFSDPDHLTTDCTDDTDESDKIRCWWIRISCAARWSAATWGRFPHTTRNTQGPGFASRDHYKVNGYILTSSAVVGIDDAGIYSGGLRSPWWPITDQGCSKGSKSGRERIKTPARTMRCPESGGDTLDAARALPQRIQLKLPRVRRKPLQFFVSPLTSRARSRRRVGRQFRVR